MLDVTRERAVDCVSSTTLLSKRVHSIHSIHEINDIRLRMAERKEQIIADNHRFSISVEMQRKNWNSSFKSALCHYGDSQSFQMITKRNDIKCPTNTTNQPKPNVLDSLGEEGFNTR